MQTPLLFTITCRDLADIDARFPAIPHDHIGHIIPQIAAIHI